MSYVLNTADQQRAMLGRIGVASIDELFSQQVPDALRLKRPLNVPPPLAEMELTRHVQQLCATQQSADDRVCFLGGGSYDHFIPAVIDAVAGRSEYYTAYTPYQAEVSQGSLQVFYEFQTLICQLTGMDVANASLYEGGSAVAEAVLMAMAVTGRHGKVLVAESMHPEYRLSLQTYLANLGAEIVVVPTPNGFLDPDDVAAKVDDQTIAVVAQHPNFFGGFEEVKALADAAHRHGALFLVSFDPVSLGVLKGPGQYEADIAVAEGQGLGVPLGYGGPYLGILACREAYVRKMPGRLVGETTDRHGKRCWVLTMQTREQHIRREKATSNICTNQGLLALRAAVHLTALGPAGLRETAELCLRKAHYAAEQLAKVPGIRKRFDRPFFKEFTLQLDRPVFDVLGKVYEQGYFGGLPLVGWHRSQGVEKWYPQLENCVSVAVTEKRTRAEIDGLVKAYQGAFGITG